MLISKFDTKDVEISIKEFEKKYKFEFPKQYKKFLSKYNGGETPKTNFKINRVSSDLDGFYGFSIDNKYHNYGSFEDIVEFKDWLRDHMLPIGDNCFGDYIMIGVGNENKGKIYFYYHDRSKRYIELTDDFISFINKCKSEKLGHIRTIEERKQNMINNGLGDKVTIESIKGWQSEIDAYANIHQEELIIEIDEAEKLIHNKQGIPKFPKLEKVVPLPFHEKMNQFIIDYKELSEKNFGRNTN